VIWFNALDSPLVTGLNALFYEPAPERCFPPDLSAAGARSRGARIRPAWQPESPDHELPVVYPWAMARRVIEDLRSSPGTPYDGLLLEYAGTRRDAPALPTIACYLQVLRPGETTRAHRHTSSAVYHVFAGSGTTRAGSTELRWRKGDSFVIPNWCPHAHENASSREDAILFVASDAPVYRALDLYREEEVEL
jgi:1-hydroxy-2-naphthoate dioxygenase